MSSSLGDAAQSAIDAGTVLVTGASSGIGMEIARQVAPRARTLIVVARRASRLESLKSELVQAHPALRVEVIPCDLARREETKRLLGELATRGLEVDVLVNNAGIGMMGAFDLADTDRVLDMLELNVTSMTLLSSALVPGMVARGRGGLLNVSSGFGLGVLPSFAAYIATKHYVTGLSEALHADLAGTGVVVTQVCPGPVATEFEGQLGNYTGAKVPRFIEQTPERCARAAIRGFDRRRAMVLPGLFIKLVLFANGVSPRFLRRAFAAVVGRMARKRELAARSSGQG